MEQEWDSFICTPFRTTLTHCPHLLRTRISEAVARAEGQEQKKRNTKNQGQKARIMIHKLLEDLRGKHLINAELKEKLDLSLDKTTVAFFNKSIPFFSVIFIHNVVHATRITSHFMCL